MSKTLMFTAEVRRKEDLEQGEIWSLVPHINLKVKMSLDAVMVDATQDRSQIFGLGQTRDLLLRVS